MEETDLRITQGVGRGRSLRIWVDGHEVAACEGETVAAVLVAMRHQTFRFAPKTGAPRGYYCGMGICHDCLVTVDGLPSLRACMTSVVDGLRIDTQHGFGG